jgi:hypothetical protein
VFENERARVLGFTTEPGQKWPLRAHPDSVAVSLSEYNVRDIIPGQAPTKRLSKLGDVRWIAATSHIGELKEPKP